MAGNRHARTAVTLLVLCGVLAFMVVYGVKAATAPLPGSSSPTKDCSAAEKEVKRFVRRSDVEISVYNAGTRQGLATKTLDRLERAGFRPGEAGNAPRKAKVRRAVVWTTRAHDTGALLVARALGRNTKVVVTETDLGPGIDVLVGNKFRGVDRKAPERLRLPKPETTCVDIGA
jgi:hypothetical protein